MKLGFIGCGNMSSAMITGIIENGIVAKEDILVSDLSKEMRDRAESDLGIESTDSNLEVVKRTDVIVLAIKPQYLAGVISEIADEVTDEKLFISIVAGKTIDWMELEFKKRVHLVRTMPNTPALVGKGMSALTPNKHATQKEILFALLLFRAFGEAEQIPEHMMDAVVAASGSAPAYVYMFIEALADAAVLQGMPRDLAYKFAAQGVLGSAAMVLETGKHPGDLKDMVCSPSGTTIEAVRTLEKTCFRSSVMEAAIAAAEKSKML